jgi:hypothetical protein
MNTVVLLISQSLAHLHNDDFLTQVMEKLSQRTSLDETGRNTVRLISTIVDSVPRLSNSGQLDLVPAEGIAFLANMIRRDPWNDNDCVPASTESSDPSSTAALLLTSAIRNGPVRGMYDLVHQIRLPTANTLFANGRVSTMYRTIFNLNRSSTRGHYHVEPVDRKAISQFYVRRNVPTTQFFVNTTSLTPITPPRRLMSAMGNVISQLEVDGKSVPASTELESVVPAFVKDNDVMTVDEKVQVFALVSNDGAPTHSKGGTSEDYIHKRSLKQALDEEAHLFRVTGGGGGWGSRAGILSLDISSRFQGSPTPSSGIEASSESPDNANTSALPSMASRAVLLRPGQIVQFFICKHDEERKLETKAQDWIKARQEEKKTLAFVGVAPPSSTYKHKDENGETNTEAAHNVAYHPNVFGAFSEQGLDVAIKEAPEIWTDTWMMDTKDVPVVSSTKFDAPGTIFLLPDSAVDYRAEQGIVTPTKDTTKLRLKPRGKGFKRLRRKALFKKDSPK